MKNQSSSLEKVIYSDTHKKYSQKNHYVIIIKTHPDCKNGR